MSLQFEDSGSLRNVGDRAVRRVRLTAESIAAIASDLGDANPYHHDRVAATASRFGDVIASASQTIGLLLGLAGSQASPERPGVGLRFDFDLKGAAKPGDELIVWWEIVGAEPTRGGTNTLVHLRGGVDTHDGRAVLIATGTTMWLGGDRPATP